jgi:hypothetical protein
MLNIELKMSERLLIAEALNVQIQQYDRCITNPDIQVNVETMTVQKRKLERIRDKMLDRTPAQKMADIVNPMIAARVG